MVSVNKKIVRVGNSNGIIIDSVTSVVTGLKLGDEVELKCQKGKITIVKRTQGE